MKNSDRNDSNDFGGSFTVDGEVVDVDLAEFGWEPRAQAAPAQVDDRPRLQKALAHAGIASRRACETLITTGRVTVNGEVEHELGTRLNPGDEVRVDGVVVQLDVSKRYFVLNKPTGVVSTMADEDGRPDLREFTEKVGTTPADRLYNVGRLDTDTSGLLILTNDGDLAHALAHPSFGVQKTYIAKVRGRVRPATVQALKDGIELKDGPIKADRVKLLPDTSNSTNTLIELTIHSGRNRIVRRMMAEVGHPVLELVRRSFGPLNLGTLGLGELREMSAAERGAILSAVEDGGKKETARSSRDSENTAKQQVRNKRREITAGRPGDGAGARGMRGIAAKGNPHGRGGAGRGNGGGKPRGNGGNGGKPGGKNNGGGSGRRDNRGGQR